jgi:hypothetical protein
MDQSPVLSYGFGGDARYGRYYKHSGRVNVGGVLLSLAAGVPIALVLAVIYAYSAIYLPDLKLAAIACVVFGVLLGLLPSLLMARFKVRNQHVAVAVALVIAALGYYFSWVAWESILLKNLQNAPTAIELAENPFDVARIAVRVNAVGTWSSSSSPVQGGPKATPPEAEHGTMLTIFWILEAAGVFGPAALLAYGMSVSKPFCEKCNRWADISGVFLITQAVDPKQMKLRLEAGEFDSVAALDRVPDPKKGGRATEFSRFKCSRCGELQTLSANVKSVVFEKKRKNPTTQRLAVVDKLLISEEDYQRMIGRP